MLNAWLRAAKRPISNWRMCRVHYYMMTLIAKLNNIMFGPLSSRTHFIRSPCLRPPCECNGKFDNVVIINRHHHHRCTRSTNRKEITNANIMCFACYWPSAQSARAKHHSYATARIGMPLPSLSQRTWRHVQLCVWVCCARHGIDR